MMVAWSSHTGKDDRTGSKALRYMFALSWMKPAGPSGKKIREERDPPPELLRGHPDLTERAIRGLSTQHVYASCVLSFHEEDIDVARFNAGDKTLRATIDQLMTEFEELMFPGIPEAMRPPMTWSTHAHTGRLELNLLVPRFVWSGKPETGEIADDDYDDRYWDAPTRLFNEPDPEAMMPRGRVLAYNPHPPGKASRDAYDSFRRLWNIRQGWADPDDPSRARLVKEPDHLIKQAKSAERLRVTADGGSKPGPTAATTTPNDPSDPRAAMHALVESWVARMTLRNREDLLQRLVAEGYQINRKGADYISLQSRNPEKHRRAGLPVLEKSIRLRGKIYSTDFTGELIGMLWLTDAQAPDDVRKHREAFEKADRQGNVAELEDRLAELIAQKRDFNRKRYGGPAWQPPPSPPELEPTEVLDLPILHRRPHGIKLVTRQTRSWGTVTPLSPASAYKARLWESLYQVELPRDIAAMIRFVDTRTHTVRFFDGSKVSDEGDRLTGEGNDELIARVMALESQAKGWTVVEASGPEAFLRATVREQMALGITVFGQTEDGERIVAEEWARLGGWERKRPQAQVGAEAVQEDAAQDGHSAPAQESGAQTGIGEPQIEETRRAPEPLQRPDGSATALDASPPSDNPDRPRKPFPQPTATPPQQEEGVGLGTFVPADEIDKTDASIKEELIYPWLEEVEDDFEDPRPPRRRDSLGMGM